MLPLTLLAPDLVEALLDGRQPEGLRLEDMLNEFPAAWSGSSSATCWAEVEVP